mgnify:CR=1 FL=1
MKIGKIVSVEYDKFRVRLFHTTKNSNVTINGQIYYFGNIGSYVKTLNSIGDTVLCEVIAVVDYNIENKIYSQYNLDSSRELVIKPIGTITSKREFNMGIGIFPSLYNDVHLVTYDDLDVILSHKEIENNNIHRIIEIGKSKSLIDYKITLDIDKLFNIHTAVLGNSGSGKSNTIARILQEVYRKKNNSALGAKTILFDVNGEYERAFSPCVNSDVSIVFLKPNENNDRAFFLPYYLMNLEEWLAFLMASDRTQKPFWDRVLQETFKFFKIFGENNDNKKNSEYENYFKWRILSLLNQIVSQIDTDTAKNTAARGIILRCKKIVDDLGKNNSLCKFLENADNKCSIIYGDNKSQLSDFVKTELSKIDIENAMVVDSYKLSSGEFYDYDYLKTAVDIVLLDEESKGNTRIREFTSTMLSRLDYFMKNDDCQFMRHKENKFLGEKDYLEKIFGIGNSTNKKQLIIIDSSEIGADVLEIVTCVTNRMIFDYRKRMKGDERRKRPIHIILDEAHRYIRKDSDYILKENIFEKIAREGRKYSMYLIISSQRPSELSSTVLSQCGNYIVHRIQNEIDMKYIYSVLPYFSEDYITKIKQSVPGEALVFGNCVPMPIQVKINRAVPDPNSDNCHISEEWYISEENKEQKP